MPGPIIGLVWPRPIPEPSFSEKVPNVSMCRAAGKPMAVGKLATTPALAPSALTRASPRKASAESEDAKAHEALDRKQPIEGPSVLQTKSTGGIHSASELAATTPNDNRQCQEGEDALPSDTLSSKLLRLFCSAKTILFRVGNFFTLGALGSIWSLLPSKTDRPDSISDGDAQRQEGEDSSPSDTQTSKLFGFLRSAKIILARVGDTLKSAWGTLMPLKINRAGDDSRLRPNSAFKGVQLARTATHMHLVLQHNVKRSAASPLLRRLAAAVDTGLRGGPRARKVSHRGRKRKTAGWKWTSPGETGGPIGASFHKRRIVSKIPRDEQYLRHARPVHVMPPIIEELEEEKPADEAGKESPRPCQVSAEHRKTVLSNGNDKC